MARIVKYLFIFLVLLVSCNVHAQKPPIYEKYAHEIINEVAKDMKKKYGLTCVGGGGSMPKKVYDISLRFHAYQHATVEEARELFIASVQALVDKVNAHEKIRPYLNEYPFTWRGADVQIAFHNTQKDSIYYLDGSVAIVQSGRKGTIAYEKAELQKKKSVDFIDYDGTFTPGKMIESEIFILLMREPYEEGVKIVANQPRPLKLPLINYRSLY